MYKGSNVGQITVSLRESDGLWNRGQTRFFDGDGVELMKRKMKTDLNFKKQYKSHDTILESGEWINGFHAKDSASEGGHLHYYNPSF